MAEDTLCECGSEIEQVGRGKPRARCDLCAARRLLQQRREASKRQYARTKAAIARLRALELSDVL